MVTPSDATGDPPAAVAEPTLTVLVWAPDAARAALLAEAAAGPDRHVLTVLEDASLAGLAYRREADLLVAEDGPALAAQGGFVRIPLVLVGPPGGVSTPRLRRQAYAIVARPAEVGLAVDRFVEHRRLARQAAGRREPPRRCSRCGRGYDSQAALRGTARRFVRFGGVSLCGGCVEELRQLLTRADRPVVEADHRR